MTKRLTITLVALVLFVMLAVLPVSAATDNAKNITTGATVFIGEQGLNVAAFYPGTFTNAGYLNITDRFAWFKDNSAAPVFILPSDLAIVPEAALASDPANWYSANATFTRNLASAGPLAFIVRPPSIDVKIWDLNQDKDVTGKSVPTGEKLTFKVIANAYVITQQRQLIAPTWGNTTGTGSYYGFDPDNKTTVATKTTEGFVNIVVKPGENNKLTDLWNGSKSLVSSVAIPINGLYVDSANWQWGNYSTTAPVENLFWNTGALDTIGQKLYPAGTYSVYAEYDATFNKMKDNYPIKCVSEVKTITIVSDTVKITANKDTVTRSKPFSVTITGAPATYYWVWVKGTGQMTGGYDDQPPFIPANQKDISVGTDQSYFYNPENTGHNVTYEVPNVGGATIPAGTYYWSRVKTDPSGVITVGFATSNQTKAQTFTIRVENKSGADYKTDETNVKVEKGVVTITASGEGSYFLGEEVKFSGTNTETSFTYLFIYGPNLKAKGSQFSTDPRSDAVESGNKSTFKEIPVNADNTWSWKWGTATVALDAGTYTVYAVSAPKKSDDLQDVAYGTVSIVIKKPFVRATISSGTVARGDKVFVRGFAEGKPTAGVAMFLIGKNYIERSTASVNSDATFEFEVKTAVTANMAPGQYFVVVQHPMGNGRFDIAWCDATQAYICNEVTDPATRIFKIKGASSLQGSDAAEALVQAILSPNVDDTYTKLQFIVEEPVIRIDAIGDRHVGDKFQITAQTNLAVDDEVLFEVYSSSFKPTQKMASNEFSGYSGAVKVSKGDSGMNKLSFDVDAATFKPDEYIVKATSILSSTTTGSALFNVLEGAAPTVAPPVVTTVAPPVVTTAPPVVTTVAPAKTPTQPGFGALVALIGLGAVAFLVVRKH